MSPTTSCNSLGVSDFEERDLRVASTIAEEAERADLRQLIYLGWLGEHEDDLSPHLRSRIETGCRLESGAVPVTTLRAAMVIGPGSAAFETVVALVDRLPAMVCPRWVGVPTQPIALDDALAYLTGVCGLEQALDRSFDIGGPEVMTYRQMIERIARLRGKHPLIVEVPLLTPRLSSYWPPPRDSGEGGRRAPTDRRPPLRNRGGEDGIDQLVPLELTPFDEAARDALSYSSSSRCRRASVLDRDVAALGVQRSVHVLDDPPVPKEPGLDDLRVVLVLEPDRHVADRVRVAVPDLIEPLVEVERADDPAAKGHVGVAREAGQLPDLVRFLVSVPVLDYVNAHADLAETRNRDARRLALESPGTVSERNESSENEVLAQELDSIGSKLLDVERRLAEVERVIQGLESAAMTTARALEEVSSHWDSVYRAMRRAE